VKIGVIKAFLQNNQAGTWVYTRSLLQGLEHLDIPASRISTLDFLDTPVSGLHRIAHRRYPLPLQGLAKIVWPNLVLPRAAAKDGFDVIHATTHYGTFVPCRFRNVITVHDITPVLFPETHGKMQVRYHKTVLPFVLKRADAIITISECSKRDILRIYGIAESKIHVVFNGVDKRFTPECRLDSAFVQGLPDRYILNIGTLEARKNLPRLLEAFAIARRKGLDRKLLIGGARGWRLSNLAGIVEKYALANDVVFLGFVPDADLPALYRRADFFIYPSVYEGFGLPILESMACGTPVITSNCSSMPEVAGDAALLVDPHDVNDMAARMLELANSPAVHARLRLSGIARAAQFSWEKTARETLAVYEMTA